MPASRLRVTATKAHHLNMHPRPTPLPETPIRLLAWRFPPHVSASSPPLNLDNKSATSGTDVDNKSLAPCEFSHARINSLNTPVVVFFRAKNTNIANNAVVSF